MARNIISGNGGDGIDVTGSTSQSLIQGNYIGTNPAGTAPVPNAFQGIYVTGNAANNTIGGLAALTLSAAAAGARNVISGNTQSGVFIYQAGPGNLVEGNYIGTDATGANAVPNLYYGVQDDSPSNTIGGLVAGSANLISGNLYYGINLYGSGASQILVVGNFVGTNPAGTSAVANGAEGVLLWGSGGQNTVGGTSAAARNVISGNVGGGVLFYQAASGNIVLGNYIGTDLTGSFAVTNLGQGVNITSSPGETIGGTVSGAGNLIAGNLQEGVLLSGSATASNDVVGNTIGLNSSGASLGNSTGVYLANSASGNTIGGLTTSARNIISGNTGSGVWIDGASSNLLVGNLIGTDPTASAARPNGLGIYLSGTSANNTIGGTVGGAGNEIAFNTGAGVQTSGSGVTGTAILENSILANGGLGIDLGGDGVTAAGTPLVTLSGLASGLASNGTISGAISATPSTTYRIELYANQAADPSGYGEGLTFINAVNVTTNASGSATFSVTTAAGAYVGQYITGTATPVSAGTLGATSEYGLDRVFSDLVTNTSNTGAGSLRQAITDANASSITPFPIGFFIASSGVQTISPATALPTISHTVLIDGYTEPGSSVNSSSTTDNAVLTMSLDGLGTVQSDGLLFTSSNNTVRGLAISGFTFTSGSNQFGQVHFSSGTNNLVTGNFLGIRPDGTVASGGEANGVLTSNLSTGNTIGGTSAASRNVISGNTTNHGYTTFGLFLYSNNNLIEGDLVGLNASGAAKANDYGIYVLGTGETIGGSASGAGNVISGNTYTGVDVNAANALVIGNSIGTNVTGTAAAANGAAGVELDSTGATVGGSGALGNLIAGNSQYGVHITQSSASNNFVLGDLIGLNASGTAIPNSASGVQVDISTGNQIGAIGAGNTIAGNGAFGIEVVTSGTPANTIRGNLIGTFGTGATAVPNTLGGVFLTGPVVLGGTASGAGNVISGNNGPGASILGSGTSAQGNFVGTNVAGTAALPNQGWGIAVTDAANVTIGPGNVVSGNSLGGVAISGTLSTNDLVIGSFIGTDVTGSTALGSQGFGVFVGEPNRVTGLGGGSFGTATFATIGGSAAGSGNVISGNSNTNVDIAASAASTSALVEGDIIGENAGATAAVAGSNFGVYVFDSLSNTIGGTVSGAGNTIGGHAYYGITLDTLSSGNLVAGNIVGLNGAGTAAVANVYGVYVNAASNTIGVPGALGGNTISGNSQVGVFLQTSATGTLIQNDLIGTNASGSSVLGNGVSGIQVNAASATIGGSTAAGAGNVISANGGPGILLNQGGSALIAGNLVGTSPNGLAKLGNGGMSYANISITTPNNTVGGTNPIYRNVISGSGIPGVTAGLPGISLTGSAAEGNLIVGNYIGTDATGAAALGNAGSGIRIDTALDTTIGGNAAAGAGNVISGGLTNGINVQPSATPVLLGTLAYLQADGTAADATGSYSPTAPNGVGYSSGVSGGQAFNFNGSNQYVSLGTSTALAPAAISVSLWVNPRSINGVYTDPIGRWGQSNSAQNSWLFDIAPNGQVYFSVTNASGTQKDAGSVSTVPLNAWTLITGTYDGTNVRIYINGVLEGSIAQTGAIQANASSTTSVGAKFADGTPNYPFNGLVDDVAIASRAFSAAEIQGIYNAKATALGGTTIQGNFIGTNAAGTAALPNASQGVLISGAGTTIGGASAGLGNVISGNTQSGIDVENASVVVLGNDIGTDAAGSAALPNGYEGFFTRSPFPSTLGGTAAGSRNVIVGGGNPGVWLETPTSGNLVQGNYIGTDRTGSLSLGGGEGIYVHSPSNTIGGAAAGAGNLVGGNAGYNIHVATSLAAGNLILGNTVGMNAAGTGTLASLDGIVLDGAPNNTVGGTATGAGNRVVVTTAGQTGVSILNAGATGNLLLGNTIGLNAAGTAALGAGNGVYVATDHNTIGGTASGARNIIDGSSNYASIWLDTTGAYSNLIQGNYLGITPSGFSAGGGSAFGVLIGYGSSNTVGGTTSGAGNVISGSSRYGVYLGGNSGNAVASANLVAGNDIGTTRDGLSPLGNAVGVDIDGGATGNTIGGPGAAFRNIISGNTQQGVYIGSTSTGGNLVAGNFIGTDSTGLNALTNGAEGVRLYTAGTGNTIGGDSTLGLGNLISGNADAGGKGNGSAGLAVIGGGGTPGTGTLIVGNLIGTDVNGANPIFNGREGVYIGGSDVTVGGTTAGLRNVISGNGLVGIQIGNYFGFTTARNLVIGDYIGTNALGTSAIANANEGVLIAGGATANTIGGDGAAFRNVISGNNYDGIHLSGGTLTASNVIAGNYVGVGSDGRSLSPAAVAFYRADGTAVDAVNGLNGVLSGGATYAAGEVGQAFSFDGGSGIVSLPGTTTGPLDITGTAITIEAWVYQTDPTQANNGGAQQTILDKFYDTGFTGYGLVTLNGELALQIATASNTSYTLTAPSALPLNTWVHVAGTYDGGTARLFVNGVQVASGSQSGAILHNALPAAIGNDNAGSGLYGFKGRIDELAVYSRVLDPQELAEIVGFGSTGKANELGNKFQGIEIDQSPYNTIGGTAAGAGNVLSGNHNWGVWIHSDGSTTIGGNVVQGNLIGTDPTGNLAVPNQYGGVIVSDAVNSGTIGGTAAGAGNVISGNGSGIYVGAQVSSTDSSNILIQGNLIGLNAAGTAQLANGAYGVHIFGPGNTVGGTTPSARNVISGNRSQNVFLDNTAATGNLIEGNYIGTLASGNASAGGGWSGIVIQYGASNNTVGGLTSTPGTGAGNMISGNGGDGVSLYGSNGDLVGNVVLGNLIGTNAAGTAAVPNFYQGIYDSGTLNTTLGGTAAGSRNVISGNSQWGVYLDNSATGTVLEGNFIGTDITGLLAVSNSRVNGQFAGGVVVINGSHNNTIGGSTAVGAGNVISGNNLIANAATGIEIYGSTSTQNLIEGNIVGLGADGMTILGNSYTGIRLYQAPNNTIGGTVAGLGNLVAENVGGIFVTDSSNSVLIAGNIVGLAADGSTPRGNVQYEGIGLRDVTGDTIGGTVAAARNVVSSNVGSGIYLYNPTTTGNLIVGNYVGTDITGTLARGNVGPGVFLIAQANGNTVGGTSAAARNIISANATGVSITGTGTSNNVIQGNYIGLDKNGAALGNTVNGVIITSGASGNTIGGSTALGAGNVISANASRGVEIDSSGNVVVGNLIGTNPAGTAAMSNTFPLFIAGANNLIGGTQAIYRNVIDEGSSTIGVSINGAGATGNTISGNYIGVDASGNNRISNFQAVTIADASNNVIGGTVAGAGNVIAGGNALIAVYLRSTTGTSSGNLVAGNSVGLGANGTTAALGTAGIYLDGAGTTNNTIGGTVLAARNVIASGPNGTDLTIRNGASNNLVVGNYVGVLADGVTPAGNSIGVRLYGAASGNTIGGTSASALNLISGNGTGVTITGAGTSGNVFLGDIIGLDVSGLKAVANTANGVVIDGGASGNTIGAVGSGNTISGNAGDGVHIDAASSNVVAGDTIGLDANGKGLGPGAVSFFPAEGSAYDAVSGVTSAVGSGTTFATGEVGQAFLFSGTSTSGVTISGSFAGPLNVTGSALTIGAWVYQTDRTQANNTANNLQLVLDKQNTTSDGYSLALRNGVPYVSVGTSQTVQYSLLGGSAIPLNTWTYLAATYDGSKLRLFVNGGQVGSLAVTGNLNSSGVNAAIGNAHNSTNYGFKGKIDELAVFSRALAAPELSAIVALGSAGTGNPVSNGGNGVVVQNGATGNTIGSGDAISGNAGAGVFLGGSLTSGNVVAGDFLGTDPSGLAVRANATYGVLVSDAPGNTIGGASAALRNVISGNDKGGVAIAGAHAVGDAVVGNYVGLGTNGSTPLGNAGDGVFVGDGSKVSPTVSGVASGILLGGTVAGSGNVISANSRFGIEVNGGSVSAATLVTIAGNVVGLTSDGMVAEGNTLGGVALLEAQGNLVGVVGSGNTISGNGGSGVEIDLGSTGNQVNSNLIGLDGSGHNQRPNVVGVTVYDGPNSIGLAGTSYSNTIAGNVQSGISLLSGPGLSVANDLIGTTGAGDLGLGNGGDGVYVATSGVTIGGSTTLDSMSAGNVISDNAANGIEIDVVGAAATLVEGNLIGLASAGSTGLGNSANGVLIYRGTGVTIGGLTPDLRNVISGNGARGIHVYDPYDADANALIVGNYIGTDRSGASGILDGDSGVWIDTGGTTVGGTASGAGNVISGNSGDGVYIDAYGVATNFVLGNLIGTDATGAYAVGNADGVVLDSGADDVIGGTDASARNIISGNLGDGVLIEGSGASNNLVAANFIGTDRNGTSAVPNGGWGVFIDGGSSDTIGGIASAGLDPAHSGPRNVISGNLRGGVLVSGDGSYNSLVEGNFIGVDSSGLLALPNDGYGVFVGDAMGQGLGGTTYGTALEVTIGGIAAGSGNVISGNSGWGIALLGDGFASQDLVAGNLVGVGSDGQTPVPNGTSSPGDYGGIVASGNSFNLISGNVISGNDGPGIEFNNQSGLGESNDLIRGNVVGLAGDGLSAVANTGNGILLDQVSGDTIGGTGTGDGNTISGNGDHGIEITGGQSQDDLILGNTIGLGSDGTALGNAHGGVYLGGTASFNTIGGTATGSANVISGNGVLSGFNGVLLLNVSHNVLLGNLIGTDPTGTHAISNGGDTVTVAGGSANNTIGGDVAGAGNTIGGQVTQSLAGIWVGDSGTTGNVIVGNQIGLVDSATLPDFQYGVFVNTGATGTTIGGTSAAARNVISNNANAGVDVEESDVAVLGNYIGLDATGMLAVPNGYFGVTVENGASGVTIGGTVAGSGNVISGNTSENIFITGLGTTANAVLGNTIGLNVAGAPLGNAYSGVFLDTGTSGTTIGGTSAAARNVISGNNNGVHVYGSSDLIRGNFIGTSADGTSAPGGQDDGIDLFGADNTVGGTVSGAGNVISGNLTDGIQIDNPAMGNVIVGNLIGLTADGSAALPNSVGVYYQDAGGNNVVGGTDPASANTISGNAAAGVQFYSQVNGGSALWLQAEGNGNDTYFGHDATVLGSVGYAPSYSADAGQAFSFDGSGDGAVEVPSFPNIGTAFYGQFTVEAWVQVNASGQDATILSNETYPGPNGFGYALRQDAADHFVFGVGNLGSDQTVESSTTLVPGQWYHIVAVDTYSYLNLYVDGQEDSAAPAFGIAPNTTNPLRIGLETDGTDPFNGQIDDVAVYDYALVTSGVATLDGPHAIDVRGVNRVQGNLVGPGAPAGAQPIGIQVGNSTDVLVGGTAPGAGNVVAGNVDGIDADQIGSNGNVAIFGNLVGLLADGATVLGNTEAGVKLDGAADVQVGGTAAGSGNTITGNAAGVLIVGGASSNLVRGNTIGLDLAGNAIGNTVAGVEITSGDQNTIGGTAPGSANVIAGYGSATADGVLIDGQNAGQNLVAGNFVGTDASGDGNLGLGGDGIHVAGGASDNSISGNVVGSNGNYGIRVSGINVSVNQGMQQFNDGDVTDDATFLADHANDRQPFNSLVDPFGGSIDLDFGTIPSDFGFGYVNFGLYDLQEGTAGRGISEVDLDGVPQSFGTAGPGFAGEVQTGFFVYLDPAVVAQNHGLALIHIVFQADAPGDAGVGIDYAYFHVEAVSRGTLIAGNDVGIGPGGQDLGNSLGGIDLDGSGQATIGGSSLDGTGNVVAFNGGDGIDVVNSSFGGILIAGNDVGTDPSITAVEGNSGDGILVSNSYQVTIGGTNAGQGNVIAANGADGIDLEVNASDNLIVGNTIGAPGGLGNFGDGVEIAGGASGNTVGGSQAIGDPNPGSRNVIGGNFGAGVNIHGDGVFLSGNLVVGNYIGTTADGLSADPNQGSGVSLGDGGFATYENTIGGAGAGNLISGNSGDGVYLNAAEFTTIQGNWIGLDATGAAALGNGGFGVDLQNSQAAQVGGSRASGQGNVISGQASGPGIYVFGAYGQGDGPEIQGNLIGTDSAGLAALPNASGVEIQADHVSIGGGSRDLGNLISGNTGDGIDLDGNSDWIAGNNIGTFADGTGSLPNQYGIYETGLGTGSTIGGVAAPGLDDASSGPRNVISGNLAAGIVLEVGTLVEGNYVGLASDGITADPNALQTFEGGILIKDSLAGGNTIGGGSIDTANAISGNDGPGISLIGPGASPNVIQGNIIGLNATGLGLIPGTVAWFRAEGDATDVVTGQAGTIGQGTTFANGEVGQAFQFDGSPDAGITFPDSPDLQLTELTIEGWIELNSAPTTAADYLIVTKGLTFGEGENYGLYVHNTGSSLELLLEWTNGATYQAVSSGAGLTLNSLEHVAVTVDGSTINFYVNGALVSSSSQSAALLPTPGVLEIGATHSGYANYFDGLIDELALYNRPLSDAEIDSIYLDGSVGKPVAPTASAPNTGDGIIVQGWSGNTVGGDTAGAGNTVSGNAQNGVVFFNASGSVVQGNRIGLDGSGQAASGNTFAGIYLGTSSGNTIGGTAAGARNIVSANGTWGIVLDYASGSNLVAGNWAGTDSTGAAALGNVQSGIALLNGSSSNTISGNVSSGNGQDGISLFGASASNHDVASNLIVGNVVGLNATGTAALPNVDQGLYVSYSDATTIGGANVGDGNTISGNAGDGLILFGDSATLVQGNWIGLDHSGSAAIGNAFVGISVTEGSTNTTISGNVISGNGTDGIGLAGASAADRDILGTLIVANVLGLSADGEVALGNGYSGVWASDSEGTTIGGTAGLGNTVSGNGIYGIGLDGSGTTLVQGNWVGLDGSGTTGLGNNIAGIVVLDGATGTTITGNVASGSHNLSGIDIDSSPGTLVLGNRAGTTASGDSAVPNAGSGISVANSDGVTICGNLASGNAFAGIDLNDANGAIVAGNLIGTNVGGTFAVPNAYDGIYLENNSANTTIGGPTAADRNVISGNGRDGVRLVGVGITDTLVLNDAIGTAADGFYAVANGGDGIDILYGAALNTITGVTASGNGNDGVEIDASGSNVVQGSFLGTDPTGTYAIPNGAGVNIHDGATNNLVGADGSGAADLAARNVIAGNAGDGVQITGAGSTGNVVAGNDIGVVTQVRYGAALSTPASTAPATSSPTSRIRTTTMPRP